jgi:hypothetical protein
MRTARSVFPFASPADFLRERRRARVRGAARGRQDIWIRRCAGECRPTGPHRAVQRVCFEPTQRVCHKWPYLCRHWHNIPRLFTPYAEIRPRLALYVPLMAQIGPITALFSTLAESCSRRRPCMALFVPYSAQAISSRGGGQRPSQFLRIFYGFHKPALESEGQAGYLTLIVYLCVNVPNERFA